MENVATYAELGKYLGAGLACIGMAGAAMGVGNVAGNYLAGALRNPSAAASQTVRSTATRSVGRGSSVSRPSRR